MDDFAKIAAEGMTYDNGLIMHEPICKEENVFENDNHSVFIPIKKMSTAEELHTELAKQRECYQEFLKEYAPEMPKTRSREYLTSFQWRMQTQDDIKNLQDVLMGKGEWENIKVPHYWGPLGKATSYYRTTFTVVNATQERYFLCFKGVDYRAKVFVNGNYLGSHEGFFAPFQFDMTEVIHEGENSLLVVVENDFICGQDGDKIYAATGLGFDDPQVGWHHCPPGMGIYQDVYIEKRPDIFVHGDVFVRPNLEEQRAEAWIELWSCEQQKRKITLEVTICGQNFQTAPITITYKPHSILVTGMGDSVTEAEYRKEGTWGKEIPLLVSRGVNRFKVPFELKEMRLWTPDEPWLYQIQVGVLDEDNSLLDCAKNQFGMRSFHMDTKSIPKGAFYFNGQKIRLRGANTMGHEQQCVYKKDFDQLIDDILLAKICNMNFWRITQRPVQPEVYEYCDKLGLMTQTDLPLFGVLRRNQFCEAVRQAEEMERLIRSHPCNVVISYINEPFPNAFNRPHLHLERDELISFFKAADMAVHLNNPDRVIKQIDGDYNPPSYGLPDNHCYPAWYNGHGIDIGKLHKGHWLPTKSDWYYGCGEFGAEGLDPVRVMRKHYPKDWLPQNEEEENVWSPNSIVGAQTGNFHYFFYETPSTLNDWVKESQKHQAWATKMMTEAFRRDQNMITFAIHLFIDAFPSGWMKTIMDVERQPKPAYFAYKDALAPLMVNIRTDRLTYFHDEQISLEAWLCNDLNQTPQNTTLLYYAKMDGKIIAQGKRKVEAPICSSAFQGYIRFDSPKVPDRREVVVALALVDRKGVVLHDTEFVIEVFPRTNQSEKDVWSMGNIAKSLTNELCMRESPDVCEVIFISDYSEYLKQKEIVEAKVKDGAIAIFLELAQGEYEIFDCKANVKECGMLPLHFVSRNTGHLIANRFQPQDFRLWYDEKEDCITPIINCTFTATDFAPILTSGNIREDGTWGKVLAVAEKQVGSGKVYICQVKLAGRTNTNPIADSFVRKII